MSTNNTPRNTRHNPTPDRNVIHAQDCSNIATCPGYYAPEILITGDENSVFQYFDAVIDSAIAVKAEDENVSLKCLLNALDHSVKTVLRIRKEKGWSVKDLDQFAENFEMCQQKLRSLQEKKQKEKEIVTEVTNQTKNNIEDTPKEPEVEEFMATQFDKRHHLYKHAMEKATKAEKEKIRYQEEVEQ